ncbi:MAG: serine hydrolase domain-containing protein, partial [Bacteroidota bacterium]
AFFHDQVEQMMQQDEVANTVIAVVVKGELIFSNGYGFTDTSSNDTVDAAQNLFRVGSVSKVFTWAAILQLAEKGLIDLDADIQQYLDFELPTRIAGSNETAEPITLRHLMTHTAGIEDVLEGLFSFQPQPSLREYLTANIPQRIYPPGEVMAYSNYGPVLAGYITERISGMPFEAYVQQNIFVPLGMNSSTFYQPLQENHAKNMVTAYRKVDGEYLPARFEHMPAPAGGLSTTAQDMVLFMTAMLNGGENKNGRFMTPATLDKMMNPAFSYHPLLGGMTHGLKEFSYNGQQVVFHGGSTTIFDAGLYLLPGLETGIFIAYSGGTYAGHIRIIRNYLDSWFPVPADERAGLPMVAAEAEPHLQKLKGEYHQSRRLVSGPDKVLNLLMGVINISMAENNTIEVNTLGQRMLFGELRPGIYHNTTPEPFYPFGPFHYLVTGHAPDGNLMLMSDGPMTYIKMPWHATLSFAALMLLPAILLALINILFYVIRAFVRRVTRKPPEIRDRSFMARAVMLTHAFLLVVFIWLIALTGNPHPVHLLPLSTFGEVGFANQLLDLMPWLVFIAFLVMAWFAWQTWNDKNRRKPARIYYLIYTVISLGPIWFFWYYNLLGF